MRPSAHLQCDGQMERAHGAAGGRLFHAAVVSVSFEAVTYFSSKGTVELLNYSITVQIIKGWTW